MLVRAGRVFKHLAGPLYVRLPLDMNTGYYLPVASVNSRVIPSMKVPIVPKERKRKPAGEGRDPMVPVRMPAAMIEALDRYAAKTKSNRSAVMRQFLEAGLKRAKA